MKGFKRVLAVMLVMAMTMAVLCACGAPDPNLGVYKLNSFMGYSLAEYAEMMEQSEAEAAESFMIELKSGGKSVFTTDGEPDEFKWKIDGSDFTMYSISPDEEDALHGTISNGIMTFYIEDIEVTLKKAE